MKDVCRKSKRRVVPVKKLIWSSVAVVALLGVAVWSAAAGSLFSANYLPHRYCYLAQPGLIWTNVSMDGLIAGSYFLIFAALFWMAWRLRHLLEIHAYLWIFFAFGTFIVACGLTHVMEVVTVWWPVYRVSAAAKVVCAIASVPTALLFVRVAPALTAHIERFVMMLSTTQQEKDQALASLIASEKLAVAGRISASIAHEIKSPLDSVANLLYVLRNAPELPEDLLSVVQTAEGEMRRASHIARSTLSLYRESAAPVAVELGPLIGSVVDLQQGELNQRRLRVEQRVRAMETIEAYPSELRQIIINLMQNAVAASGPGSRIFVRAQARNGGCSITIADQGAGVAPDHRPRLFSLFFTTKGDEGTGLGLWLVQSLVEKHGGRIRFRSRTAGESPSGMRGTLFNIWLPACRMDRAAAAKTVSVA
jgi:signal transduction histidine kinase